jgi:hypothetical protein
MMSLMGGMMGGMGMMGGGMGMMGGGMGMMGGGMMGGMGGGFRSVPPTSLPFTTLKPKQTRHLPTRLVGIAGPGNDVPVAMPAKGEKLRIGDIDHATRDERVRTALKRLAADKAPQNISQLVMWNVAGHLDWGTIAARSKGWANRQELTLARQMVERLDRKTEGETGVLLYEINAADGGQDAASALSGALKDKMVLGLKAESGVPAHPEGPAVACKVRVNKGDAMVQVGISDGTGQSWTAAGKFTVPLTRDKDKLNTTALVDALAEGILDRLVRVQIAPGPRVKGKPSFKLKIENASPLVLNGLAVLGRGNAANEVPKVLSGICIAPSRSMTVPASEEMVKGLGLRKGVRVIAADLSGL